MEAIEMLSETLALENCPSVNKLTMTSQGKNSLASSDKAKGDNFSLAISVRLQFSQFIIHLDISMIVSHHVY